MGGVVNAISNAAESVASVVTAPVTVVSEIVSGGNVVEAVGHGVAQGAGGTVGMATGITQPLIDVAPSGVPILDQIKNVTTVADAARDTNGNITRGQAWTGIRDAGIVAGAVGGGMAVAAGSLSATAALTGAGLANQIGNGQMPTLNQVGGLVGVDMGAVAPYRDAIGNFIPAPAPASPVSAGIPSAPQAASPGAAAGGMAKSSGASPMLLIGAVSVVAVGAYFLLKRR